MRCYSQREFDEVFGPFTAPYGDEQLECEWGQEPVQRLPFLLFSVLRLIAPFSWAVVHLHEAGAWSGANNSLFAAFRESFGERRLLDDAPWHYCGDYEEDHVFTLLQLTMLNAWVAEAYTESDHYRIVVTSGSSKLVVTSRSAGYLDELTGELIQNGYRCRLGRATRNGANTRK